MFGIVGATGTVGLVFLIGIFCATCTVQVKPLGNDGFSGVVFSSYLQLYSQYSLLACLHNSSS